MKNEDSVAGVTLNEIEKLGIPIVLMGAVYGVFATVLTGWEKLNDRRDLIVEILKPTGASLSIAQKSLVFCSDWLPMYVGICFFMLVFSLITITIPRVVKFRDRMLTRNTALMCWLAGGLFAFGFFGFVAGGILDYLAMSPYLSKRDSLFSSIGFIVLCLGTLIAIVLWLRIGRKSSDSAKTSPCVSTSAPRGATTLT